MQFSSGKEPGDNEHGTTRVDSCHKGNLISRKYPLARGTYAYIKRPPRLPVDPKVKELLHYILSNKIQNIVHRVDQYLPLTIEAAPEQLLKLE
jgi:hypothetical protein